MRFFKRKEQPSSTAKIFNPASSLRLVDLEGLIQFKVPASWQEEYDDGLFLYYREEEPFTLRASVMTLQSPKEVDENTALEIVSMRAEDCIRVEQLSNGNALATSRLATVEEGTSARRRAHDAYR